MKILEKISYRIRLVRDMWRLGDRAKDKFLLAALCVTLPLLRRGGMRGTRGFPVRVSIDNHAGYYSVHDTTDLGELDAMFVRREYDLPQVEQEDVRSIIDLGACSGASSLFFALRYPNAAVYAFEPDAGNFEKLLSVVKLNPALRLFPINKALAALSGPVSFYESLSSGLSSSTMKRADVVERNVEGITMRDMASLVKEPGIDIFKFDIEGGEIMLIPKDFPKTVRVYVGEVHPDLMGLPAEEFAARFSGKIDRESFRNGKREIIRVNTTP